MLLGWLLQAHTTCRQLKQQLLQMDKDLSKAGEGRTIEDVLFIDIAELLSPVHCLAT